MSEHGMRIYIDRDRMWGDSFAVRMGRTLRSGEVALAQEMAFVVMKPDEVSMETRPCFTLKKNEAQSFMDELWHAGFRPTEGTGSAGAMAAVQAHLKDMQRLVFKDKPAQPK